MSVIGFDWDGTLVESWTSTPLPGVRERLHALPPGTRTFIATNQAGPVFRATLEDAKYPAAAEVAARIAAGLAALDWRPDMLLVCVAPPAAHEQHKDWVRAASAVVVELHVPILETIVRIGLDSAWRKPQPGMLIAAAEYYGCLAANRPRFLTYVGDMDSDEAAAHAAGARFVAAADWRSS